jgi:hypothetical protein
MRFQVSRTDELQIKAVVQIRKIIGLTRKKDGASAFCNDTNVSAGYQQLSLLRRFQSQNLGSLDKTRLNKFLCWYVSVTF